MVGQAEVSPAQGYPGQQGSQGYTGSQGYPGSAGLPRAAAIPRAAGLPDRSEGAQGGWGGQQPGGRRVGDALCSRGAGTRRAVGFTAAAAQAAEVAIPVGAAAAVVVIVVALVLTLGGGSSSHNNAGSNPELSFGSGPVAQRLPQRDPDAGESASPAPGGDRRPGPTPATQQEHAVAEAQPGGAAHRGLDIAEVFYASNTDWVKNGSYPGNETIKKDATAARDSAFGLRGGSRYSKSRDTWTDIVPDATTWPAGRTARRAHHPTTQNSLPALRCTSRSRARPK